MAAESLSEGEIADSSGGEEGSLCKRIKLSEEEGSEPKENMEGGWTLVTSGPRKRKGSLDSNQQTKKKKKRNRISYEDSTLVQTASPLPVSETPTQSLNLAQKQLLQLITTLVDGKKALPSDQKHYKTNTLQIVLRHIVLGNPILKTKRKQTSSLLSNKKVLVIWLSSVSKEDFESKAHFNQVKSLSPQVTFAIIHPGSDRFVQFGLQEFMNIKESAIPPSPKFNIPLEKFSRFDCLLNHHELIQNEYPLPGIDDQTSQPDDDYICLAESWPNNMILEHEREEIKNYPMFSVDCEMIQTEIGSELARVSIIDEDMKCIYSTLVKPSHPVVNYLTKYSGINENTLEGVDTTLSDLHVKLKELLPAKFILIGHSLENDLAALKLHHPYIIDTALLFTPYATPKLKPGLRLLAKKLLDKDIQTSTEGHDPTEDATTCMELVKKKLIEGSQCVIQWNENVSKTWLPSLVSASVRTTVIDKQSLVSLYTSQSQAKPCIVNSDEEAVEKAQESLLESRFVFVHFHSLENYRKNNETLNDDEICSVISLLDQWSYQLVQSAPNDTVVFIVCGSNNIKEVRRLQKEENVDQQALKTAVMKAREGLVLATLK